MKLHQIAFAVAAALIGSQASALNITTTNAASTVKVYASGATAVTNVLAGIFVQNCAGGLDIYGSKSGAGPFAGDAANGDSNRVLSCTLKAEADLDTDLKNKGLGGKNIALWKRDSGGSSTGVFQVALALPSNDLVISSGSCTSTGAVASYNAGTAVYSFTCTQVETVRAPDIGFSDVEPAFFTGVNVPDDLFADYGGGLSTTDLAGLTIVPTFQTVFAVAVSNKLFTALQTAQGTSGVPSISTNVAGSLFRGELADPANGKGWHALGVATPDSQVNVCRRVPGSGTQAAANLQFSNFPCSGTAINAPVRNDASDTGVNNINGPFTGGSLHVYEGPSTGNVRSCLTNANTQNAYAIGHVSRENAETAAWKFVALDGMVPSRDNMKDGKYTYGVESTAQYLKSRVAALKATVPGNPTQTALNQATAGFIEGFALAVGRPANLARIATATQNGVAALPGKGVFGFASPATADSTFVSRVSRTDGNNCTPLSVVK